MKWISIKDRLPEVLQDIVATNGDELEIGFYSSLGWCDFSFEPTHWFPIPDPAKLDAED